jgi:hypothetical protein
MLAQVSSSAGVTSQTPAYFGFVKQHLLAFVSVCSSALIMRAGEIVTRSRNKPAAAVMRRIDFIFSTFLSTAYLWGISSIVAKNQEDAISLRSDSNR